MHDGHAGDVTEAIVQWLLLAENTKLEHAFAKFVALGLSFLFLGQQEAVEATLEVARSVHERIARVASVMLDTCAYAGTGNVLKVQEMLSICGETIDAEEGAEWKVRDSGCLVHSHACLIGAVLSVHRKLLSRPCAPRAGAIE
jgi:26S proteasome regulatory subunit N1